MAPTLICLDCHIPPFFQKPPSIGAFSPISQIPATPDPPPRISCKCPISKLYSSQEWPSYGSSETLIPHFIFLSLRYPPPTQPHKSENPVFHVTFPPYDLCRKTAFPYQPTGNPSNVTFSPVGIICPLSYYKALVLCQDPVEMMEKHPVEDGPLRMSGKVDSCHDRRQESRNGPIPSGKG